MPNPVKSIGYIKCYSSISCIAIKSLTILSGQKICSWLRRRKTILEIGKKVLFLWVILNKTTIYKFLKDLTNHRRKNNRVVVFCHTSCANILNNRDHQWDFPIFWKSSFRHILKISAFKKFQAHIFLGLPLEYDQNQTPLANQDLFNIFRVTEILRKFRLVLGRKTGKEIPYSSRLEFLGKFLENYFNLSYAKGSISGLPNREDIADLPSLRTLLAIRQKFWEQRSLKVMGFFVLLAYSSLPASRALLQRILAYLNVNLKSEDLFCRFKQKKLFLWTMAAAQAGENYGDE